MKKITPNRITAIWKEYVQLLNLKQVERISIPETVRQHQAKCRDVVKSGSVRPWILCFDEALQFLRYLHDWTWELQSHYPDKMRAVTMLLTGRLCTLASAIRLLAISGFEEQARILARTFLETSDLSLAILADDALNVEYMREDAGRDNRVFWRNHCRTQSLRKYLRNVGVRAGLSHSNIDAWVDRRLSELRDIHSGPTHVAIDSVFRSTLVPSLSHPAMLTHSTFGHLSVHTPGLVLHMTDVTWEYGGVFLKLVMGPNPPTGFERVPNSRVFDSMLASFMTLQHLLTEENLPALPRFECADGESDEEVESKSVRNPIIEQAELKINLGAKNKVG